MKESSTEQKKRISDNIQEYGWHCLHVFPTEMKHTRFSYTIGFRDSYNAPEIAIFGLEPEKAHALLNECAHLLKNGQAIQPDLENGDILGGDYNVVFKRINKQHYSEYLGTAIRFYEGNDFDAMVMFIPDRLHRFPWDQGYDDIPAHESLSIV